MQEQKKKPWDFLKSDEDSSASETEKNTRKKLIAELIKTSVLVLCAFGAIVFGTAAWFVSNTKVGSSGIVISHQYDAIKLATKGNRQKAEENLLKLKEGETLPVGDDTYYYTEDETIALRLSEDNVAVFPGASGTVTFYIIPTQDGPMSAKLYVSLAGYKTAENNTSAERIADPILDALLSGHILLFQKKDANGHYSDWLGKNNTINVMLPDSSKKDKPYPVSFHWIWPLRYENMRSDLYADESQPEAKSFLTFLDNQAESMTPISGGYSYSRIYLTNEADLTTTASRSKAYNLADEYIGTNAQYLYLAIQTAAVPAETN